jgi:hypothetical protein
VNPVAQDSALVGNRWSPSGVHLVVRALVIDLNVCQWYVLVR